MKRRKLQAICSDGRAHRERDRKGELHFKPAKLVAKLESENQTGFLLWRNGFYELQLLGSSASL
jgi:hypothetical protein